MINEKEVLKGLKTLGISAEPSKISFLTQSCFPIYLIQFNKISKQTDVIVKAVDIPEMAHSEILSLKLLEEKSAFVPHQYGHYNAGNESYIFMEYISGSVNNRKDAVQVSLEALYKNRNKQYGLDFDNFVGSLKQKNKWYNRFDDYFWESRLLPMVETAINSGQLPKELLSKTEKLLKNKTEEWELNLKESFLIHGDLWNGNILFGNDKACLIDPSISYGHPEQDFGMLLLFGASVSILDLEKIGLSIGLSPDLKERIPFWQLYPLLVHVNLFGSSYVSGVLNVFRRYL